MNIFRTFLITASASLSTWAVAQSSVIPTAPIAKEPPKASLGAITLGPKSGSDVLHLAISLNYRDPAGMQRFVDSLSDPRNLNYRHFISPDEVGRRFGLSSAEVAKVTGYLKSQGMSIRLIGQNRLSILADATVAQAQTAFSTTIRRYSVPPSVPTDSGERFSFTTPPEVPLSIVRDVADISGLENFTRPRPLNLTPVQLQGLYSVAPMYTRGMQGQGRTIAISNWDGFRISNEQLQCQNFKLPIPIAGAGSNITIESIDGGDGADGFEYGEGDLDIQANIEMAPLCNLIIYDNDEPSGNANLIDVLTQEADDNLADLITESYGWALDIPTALAAHNLHLSMSAQGITYMAASGDSGTDFAGYDYPVIDPEVLTVGGTSAAVTSQDFRLSEVGWNSLFGAGGGGWAPSSDTFNVRAPYQLLPSFLAGPGVPSASAVPYRLVPDVALNADPNTGYYVWFSTGPEIIGGTSGASPTCAGSLADTEEQLIADGFLPVDSNGHYRFGRIQDLLYSYNGNPAVFYDIVSGSNGSLPNGAISKAGPGWDFDSGWGPIVFSGLVAAVEKIPQVETLTVSATVISGGAPVTGTVTLTAPAGANGTLVNLASNKTDVKVPATVTVPANAMTASFTISTTGVAAEEVASVTASNAYGLQAATLSIFPATYSGISISPAAVTGGNQVMGTVTLQGAAPPAGFLIYLSSNSSLATVPSSVTIPSNSTSATFPITTAIVTSDHSAAITGISDYGLTKTAVLAIQTPIAQQVTFSSPSVVGGSNVAVTGSVTLSGPARKGGDVVRLVSSAPKLLTVPASVTIPSGATSVDFKVSHRLVSSTENVTVTATYSGSTQQATVTINPFQVVALSASPGSLAAGGTSTGEVNLNAPVGPQTGAVVVKLSSSLKSIALPSVVSILSGSASGKFTITCKSVASAETATITGTLGASSEQATLSLGATSLAAISVSPSSVKGSSATRVVGMITLNGAAPAGGFVVSLSSSNTLAVVVPAAVTIPAGRTSATFTVRHSAVSSQSTVTIAATANGTAFSTALVLTP